MSGYARWMEKSHIGGTFPPDFIDTVRIAGPTGNSLNGTVGQVITATNQPNGWSNSPTGYTYMWVRGYVPWTVIAGATAATYTLVAADSGNPIRCVVSATNAAGTTQGPPSGVLMCA